MIEKGTKLLLITSYCENSDNELCSDIFPCEHCLRQSNVVEIKDDVEIKVLGGMENLAQLESKQKDKTMKQEYYWAVKKTGVASEIVWVTGRNHSSVYRIGHKPPYAASEFKGFEFINDGCRKEGE